MTNLASEMCKPHACFEAAVALLCTPIDWLAFCTMLRADPKSVIKITGQLAVFKAIESRKLEYLRLVLAYGADPNEKCPYEGRAPLSVVAGAAGMSVATTPETTADWLCAGKILLEYGADVNVRDMHNCTPLIQSLCLGGNVDMIILFVDGFGADVNARDRYGLTVLHYLAKVRKLDPDIIASLIARGADKTAVSRRGVTPVDIALISGAPSWLVDMLA